MSGPIVRSGPSTKFSANWEKAFGKKKTAAQVSKKKSPRAKGKSSKKKT